MQAVLRLTSFAFKLFDLILFGKQVVDIDIIELILTLLVIVLSSEIQNHLTNVERLTNLKAGTC